MKRCRRRWIRGLSGMTLLLGCLGLYGLYLSATLSLPRGEDRQPLRIYGAPYPLSPGLRIEKARLQNRLDHLGYRRVSRKLQSPGEYRTVGSEWELYLRDFVYPEGRVKGRPVRLAVEDGQVSQVLGLPDETDAGPLSLEPPLLGGLLAESRQVREWIAFEKMPSRLVEAVLAVEDHRFYHHIGVDPLAIVRAAWENMKGGGVRQGGSTITQQLAKNLYYTRQRTFFRKIRESIAALILEMKYSKEDILESYLNEIYLGQSGSVAVYGVGEGAHYYFGKSLSDLTVPEAALLAGMIKGPNTYAPVKNPSRAKKRRDIVLLRLKQEGKLTDKQYQAAVSTPIRAATLQKGLADAPYFVDYLLSHLEDSAQSVPQAGLRIFTTRDPEMQRLAEEAVSTGLTRLETRYRFLVSRGDELQAALVALDPKTGSIRAMVGGRDYGTSQFNHAVQAKRQAGSLFKPFVYLAAFERSTESNDSVLTPATLLEDTPISFANGTSPWSPQNYDRKFHGQVTVRTAVEQSLNIPAVRVAQAVGVRRIIDLMRHLGVKGPLDEDLSFALGTSDVSLIEMTGAFGALAQGGRFFPPTGLHAVSGEQPEDLVMKEAQEPAQIFSPQSAYLMTSTLKGVVERGTAAQAKAMGLTAPVAGKTGTTDDHRDAWFIGYTPDIVIGVWVGYDDGSTLKLTGAQAALPIWVDFFQKAIPIMSGDFPVPSGVVSR
ncbi:MAG: PBP1A family penicillin-binding protein, partial [Nitrospiraceae bacterium]